MTHFNNWKITSLSFLVYGHVFLAGIALYSVGSAINNIFVICKLPCIVLRFVVCPRLTYFYTLSSVRVDKSSQDSPMILQSTPLVTDTKGPRPLSFIEGVSPIEGFWSR